MTSRTLRLLVLVSALPATAGASATDFGGALQCQSSKVVTMAAAVPAGLQADGDWALESARRVGYPVALPKSPAARAAALRTSALLHSGHIVAAKMANDEATPVAGYAAFGEGMESLMTILTQPVAHASYPSSVRANGESREDGERHEHTFGVDMEASSASLRQVIVRAQVAKRAMGDAYTKPAVRYYLLAHGFRDDIALPVATAQVCALRLSKDTVRKLDTSARFMAMPQGDTDAPEAKQ